MSKGEKEFLKRLAEMDKRPISAIKQAILVRLAILERRGK